MTTLDRAYVRKALRLSRSRQAIYESYQYRENGALLQILSGDCELYSKFVPDEQSSVILEQETWESGTEKLRITD